MKWVQLRASNQCDLAMKRLARAACQQQQKPAMCLVQRRCLWQELDRHGCQLACIW